MNYILVWIEILATAYFVVDNALTVLLTDNW